jgi:hypothetical protein
MCVCRRGTPASMQGAIGSTLNNGPSGVQGPGDVRITDQPANEVPASLARLQQGAASSCAPPAELSSIMKCAPSECVCAVVHLLRREPLLLALRRLHSRPTSSVVCVCVLCEFVDSESHSWHWHRLQKGAASAFMCCPALDVGAERYEARPAAECYVLTWHPSPRDCSHHLDYLIGQVCTRLRDTGINTVEFRF